jgi:hypothetical protein
MIYKRVNAISAHLELVVLALDPDTTGLEQGRQLLQVGFVANKLEAPTLRSERSVPIATPACPNQSSRRVTPT